MKTYVVELQLRVAVDIVVEIHKLVVVVAWLRVVGVVGLHKLHAVFVVVVVYMLHVVAVVAFQP